VRAKKTKQQERPPPPSSSSSTSSSFGFIVVPEDDNDNVEKEESKVEQGGSDEPRDLLEYFDPLLSPHVYPNDIDAAAKAAKAKAEADASMMIQTQTTTGRLCGCPARAVTPSVGRRDDEEFGLSRIVVGGSKRMHKQPHELDDDDDLDDEMSQSSSERNKRGTSGKQQPTPDPFDIFDPRISPHACSKGIPKDAVTYASNSRTCQT